MKNIIILLFLVLLFNSCKKEIENTNITEIPVSDFIVSLASANGLKYSYDFQNLSENATEYCWYFGNGDSSKLKNPLYNYKQTGVYNITLIVKNNNSTDTSMQVLVVEAIPIENRPIAEFILQFNIDTPTSAIILNRSKNYTTCTWVVDDVIQSNEVSPTLQLSNSEKHIVKLITENENHIKVSFYLEFIPKEYKNKFSLKYLLINLNPTRYQLYATRTEDIPATYYFSFGSNPKDTVNDITPPFYYNILYNDLLPHSLTGYYYKKNISAYKVFKTFDLTNLNVENLISSLQGNYNFFERKIISDKNQDSYLNDTILNVFSNSPLKLQLYDSLYYDMFSGYLSSESTSEYYRFKEMDNDAYKEGEFRINHLDFGIKDKTLKTKIGKTSTNGAIISLRTYSGIKLQ